MPNHLLSWPLRWIPALTGALLLLTENPVLAANPPRKSASASAEQCRQLAARWWGDRPGIEFEEIDPAVAVPACQRSVKEHPNNADLKAYLCRALMKAERPQDALSQCRQAAEEGSPEGIHILMRDLGGIDKEDTVQVMAWVIIQKNHKPKARVAAIKALGLLGDLRGLNVLITNLWDTNVDIREAVASVLGELGNPQTIIKVRAALDYNDPGVREAATKTLGNLGYPQVIEPLLLALKDPDAGVRKAAAEALGKLEDPRAVEPLLIALHDPDWKTHVNVALALATLRDSRAVDPLLEISTSIIHNKHSLDRWLLYPLVARALGLLQDPQAVKPLLAAVREEDAVIHNSALNELSNWEDRRAVNLLLTALREDAHPGVRSIAAIALGNLQDPQAIEPLIAVLQNDSEAIVRSAAAMMLGIFGDPRAVKPLLSALSDSAWVVRMAAAKGLGPLKDPQTVEPLLITLHDPDYRVRMGATQALGVLGNPKVLEPLLTALQKDSDVEVRRDAAEALGALGNQRAVDSLLVTLREDTNLGVRQAAIGALVKLEDLRAVAPLIAVLGDTNPEVRQMAAEALGELKDPQAVEPLLAALLDTNEKVRSAAAGSLITHFNGLADARIVVALRHSVPEIWRDSLQSDPDYAREVLDLIQISTTGTAYRVKLQTLGKLWAWSGPRAVVAEATLDADLAAMCTAHGTEAVAANPYLALFVARLHQEQGRNDAALSWLEHARPQIPAHEIAPQIVLGWIEAQALRQAGRPEPALTVVTRLERDLLPRLAGIERRSSGLPFDSQTLVLKGILLDDLDQHQKSIEALQAAQAALKWEQQRKWITEITFQQVQYIIDGFQAKLNPDGAAKAQAVLAAALTPASRLEQEAQRRALVAKLQEAIGNRDYKQAQQFGERLALTQQPVPSDLQLADPARQAAFKRLQDLQQRIRQLDSDQNAAEQALQQATREGDVEKIAEKRRDFQAAKARRQKGWNELQDAVAQLKREYPQLAALLRAEPVELSRWQARLQPQQRLVRYLLLENQGWAFVQSAHTIEVVALPAGWKALREPIRDYRLLLQTSVLNRGFALNRGFIPDPPAGPVRNAVALGQQLSQQLIEPLRPHLQNVTHLLIVPNGPLHDLPFSALPWNGHFLVEQFHLSTLSSTSLLATLDLQPPAAPPQLIALGNPIASGSAPLPAAEQEVKAIAALFVPPAYPQPAIYLNADAQRNRLIGQDLNSKMLHLAVHGQAGSLETTQLILSDGPLKVNEVWGLALGHAPLVVLSACQTALGEHLGGDAVVSLANGFMVAGAQSVVSSLWPVPDEPTRLLMETFYTHRSEGHAAALAAAQRALIQQGRDPYHWAGFVVGGW